jgi:tetratricopeptide (TPR) repeat protein
LLDGLPLAIAQAGAYLQESGVGLQAYLQFYDQQWKELMDSREQISEPLQDYPDRSIWTTWVISYNIIRAENKFAANLLLLWSLLDNKGLWHDLFATACANSSVAKRQLLAWIGDLAIDKLEFLRAMPLLRSYSLIEDGESLASYATHLVVHKWALHYQDEDCREQMAVLALLVVGWAIPEESMQDCFILQRRLLPHADACSHPSVVDAVCDAVYHNDMSELKKKEHTLEAIHMLGLLYTDQNKFNEAEKLYERVLKAKEVSLGKEHIAILRTVNNLGMLYVSQDKLDQAESMLKRALQGKEETNGK